MSWSPRNFSEITTDREIVVQFNADVADGMQWKFTPTQREVRVKPGESALASYIAGNKSSAPITGVSTYNVTPMKAGVYINKIQCFRFEEQRLLPGEQIDMPSDEMNSQSDKVVRRTMMVATVVASYFLLTGPEPNLLDPIKRKILSTQESLKQFLFRPKSDQSGKEQPDDAK